MPRSQRVGLSTVFALWVVTMLGGCSNAGPSTGQDPGGAGPQQAAEPKVKRLVMAVLPPLEEGNDPRAHRGNSSWVYRPFYEYLVGMDPQTGKSIPQLATEWKLQPDGKSFLFKLRQGVKFHRDRGEFGPDALTDTFKLQTRDPTVSTYELLFPLIAGIDKLRSDEVLIRLKSSDGTFLSTMSEERGVFYMLNAQHFQELGQPDWQTGPAVGTGPYQFKERALGEFIRYERVPYQHWRTMPEFPEFEFRFMKEASTRLASLLTGEVHISVLPSDLKTEAQARGFKVIPGKVPGLRAFVSFLCCLMKDRNDVDSGWQHPESPLADARVRRALSKAIDRTQLNKAYFQGEGEVMVNHHFHPTLQGWDPSWERRFQDQYGYDPEAAKRLLAEAGYSAAKPVDITVVFPSPATSFAGADEMMDAIAGMWRAIGVKASFITVDLARRSDMRKTGQFYNHIELNGTASDQWTGMTTYGSTQGTCCRGIEIPDADRLLAKIRQTLDEHAQDAIWRGVGEVVFVQHKEIPLLWIPVEAVTNPQIVADWSFPGRITGAWTHVFNIKAAR